MSNLPEAQCHWNAHDDTQFIGVKFAPQVYMNNALLADVLHQIADKIATKYVADNYQEVIQHIKPEAVATLVAAESAAEIRKTLYEKIPERVMDVVRREVEVWQKGIFGGIKRIR